MNINLRVLVLLVACMLPVASFASVKVACKSGQKTAQQGGAACPAAPKSPSVAKTKTKASTQAKAVSKAKAGAKASSRTKAKSRVTTRTRATRKSRGTSGAKAAAVVAATGVVSSPMQAAPALPANPIDTDCSSVQLLLQGGAPQCPLAAAGGGPGLATQPPPNPGTPCFAALASSNASQHFAARVPFLAASAASAQALANTGVPNKDERKALGSLVAGYGLCTDMAASWRRQVYAPGLDGALVDFWRDAQAILSGLAGGKRSFGEAARAIADLDRAYKIRLDTLGSAPQPAANLLVPKAAQ